MAANGDRLRRAVVRGVPDTYPSCIRPPGETSPIDVTLARRQHERYCSVLEALGMELTRLEADNRYPDCCFVEDTAVVAGGTAVICHMGAPGRRGEEAAVAGALSALPLYRLAPPATLDGGDVISDGRRMFVGLTERTNLAAARSLEKLLGPMAIDVVAVPVAGFLHLKSACTLLAPGLLLVSGTMADAAPFAGYERLVVPEEESYAANCLSVGGVAIVSEGFPRTRELIESCGIPTETVATTEFRKGGGSLTCLSVLF
jgi:dimethylargininase